MLVRAGLIGETELEAARSARAHSGGTLAEHLVLGGYVDDEELTAFYRNRLLVPRVAPADLATLAVSVVGRLPEDMAIEFRSVPVMSDREGNLTVVMSDPADSRAVDEIAFFTGSYVVRAVATQAQIAWCLAHYYDCITPLYKALVGKDADKEAPVPTGGAKVQAPASKVGSITGQVAAMRHSVVPPGVDPGDQKRPSAQTAAAAEAETPAQADSDEARERELFDTGETQPMKTIPAPPKSRPVGPDGAEATPRGAQGRRPPPDTDETRPIATKPERPPNQEASPPRAGRPLRGLRGSRCHRSGIQRRR